MKYDRKGTQILALDDKLGWVIVAQCTSELAALAALRLLTGP